MIRVVPDTNVLLSGMFGFPGKPRKIINLALAKKIVMYGSEETYKEFCEKIFLPRIQKYFKSQIFTPKKISLDYRAFINMVEPFDTLAGVNIVQEDPDDDIYFRVAKTCNAKIIITGDKNVLKVKKYEGILVVRPADFINSFNKLKQRKLS